MKYSLFFIGIMFHLSAFSQKQTGPVEVTTAIKNKILQEIDKEISVLRNSLKASKMNAVNMEFCIDTFRVERFMSKWIGLDYSDPGMQEATYGGADLYDSLLNKYYKRLLIVLKGDDKKNLVQAQKAWLSFRGAEMNLVATISKEQYSGGGTMQRLTESAAYLALIRNRTIDIFNHLTRATQNE